MSEALQTAYTTALNTIQTDVNAMVTAALPIALGIAGLFIAIRLGISFFKSVAH